MNDFIQAAGALGGGAQWFAPTWSLGVEEQFYLLWPIVLLVVLRRADRQRVLSWLVVAAVAAAMLYPATVRLVGTGWMYYSPLGSLLPLMAGCGAAFTRRRTSPIVAALAAASAGRHDAGGAIRDRSLTVERVHPGGDAGLGRC